MDCRVIGAWYWHVQRKACLLVRFVSKKIGIIEDFVQEGKKRRRRTMNNTHSTLQSPAYLHSLPSLVSLKFWPSTAGEF